MTFSNSSTVKTYYIPCLGNTSYAISKVAGKQFRIGTTDIVPTVGGSLLQAYQVNSQTKYVITTNEKAKYLCINICNSSTDTLDEQTILDSVQIEKNSITTSYVNFEKQEYTINLNDLKLYGVGSSQDYIYKNNNNNKWYIKRHIGKMIVDGNQNWVYEYSTAPSWAAPRYNIYKIETGYNKAIPFIDSLCNYFSFTPDYQNYAFYDETFLLRYVSGQGTRIDIMSNTMGASNVNEFKAWLNLHKPELYYILAEPTEEEITDINLINQLNILEKAYTYSEQTNIFQDKNDNLPLIITAHALESN